LWVQAIVTTSIEANGWARPFVAVALVRSAGMREAKALVRVMPAFRALRDSGVMRVASQNCCKYAWGAVSATA
jgi:hypothetical protein